MERAVTSEIGRIGAEEYASFKGLQHLYLVGDLKKPNEYPFFRDQRVEMIVCYYSPGDDGAHHWHSKVTEYEIILEGMVGYLEAASGIILWFHPGDCSVVPAGVCVKRLIPERARTVAIKVPSSAEKIQCRACSRDCPSRQQPYVGD